MRFLVYVSCLFWLTMSQLACKKSSIPEEADATVTPNETLISTEATVWPFDQPLLETLRSSEKKVFAHYFTQFPISIDNKDPKTDYYTRNYLNPSGESGKHLAYGGYLRNRPLGRSPRSQSNWMNLDMEEEVKRAAAIGIDGFACDLLTTSGYHLDRTKMLLSAAAKVDAGFTIMLMPDMSAFKNITSADLKTLIVTLAAYPAAYRLSDGRLVVAPYNAHAKDVAWWTTWMAEMQTAGIKVALVPVFQGWEKYAAAYAPISYGMSDWGWRSVKKQASWLAVPSKAKAYGPKWMMPVSPQDMRPKELRFWEAGNSSEFRVMWENAINGGADWVQLITWNDYSEHTVVAPSTATQYALYDLAAYYVTWFKMGTPPPVKRDVIYYFHRIHATTVTPNIQTSLFKADSGSDPLLNEIELLAFLHQAGTLEIEVGEKKYQQAATVGLNSFRIPLASGTPVFRLIRNDNTVIALNGAFEIKSSIDYQNLLYYGGGSTRQPVTHY
jgi:hypothetical protein